jgi:hypothetical protein
MEVMPSSCVAADAYTTALHRQVHNYDGRVQAIRALLRYGAYPLFQHAAMST